VSEAKASPTLLLKDIQKHVHAKAMADDRDQKVIHPSEMCKDDWCPRQTFLRIRHYRQDDAERLSSGRSYSFQLQNIFEEGHDVHRKYQGWLAEMGRLYGTWVDKVDGEIRHGHTLSAEDYATGNWRYKEVPLFSEKFLIGGHGDGAVIDLSALIEVKTIGMGTLRFEEPTWLNRFLVETVDGTSIYDLDKAWKELRRPLKSHIKQTNIYGFLAKEMGIPIDRVIFIYEYKANQGVKEYSVKFNQDLIQDLLDKAYDIKKRLDNDSPPPRKPEHTGPEARVCKECPFYKECWDGPQSEAEQDGRDVGAGRRKPKGRSPRRAPGAGRADEAEPRASRSSRRPHRSDGPATDEPVQPTGSVDELPWRSTGRSGGRREGGKRRTRQAQGSRGAGEQD
jgi:CRISPR/Cas system-associated exonuclease Cas4 (RecB family)